MKLAAANRHFVRNDEGSVRFEALHLLRGFTLLEVIVVLAILAIISALAFVNLGAGGQSRALEQAAQRAKLVLEQMCERASFEGKLYGMLIYADGYEVQTPGSPTPPIDGSPWLWQVVKSPGFERVQIDSNIKISLDFAGETLNLPVDEANISGANAQTRLTQQQRTPQLVCIDDQSWPQFRLRFSTAQAANSQNGTQSERWVEQSNGADGILVIGKPQIP